MALISAVLMPLVAQAIDTVSDSVARQVSRGVSNAISSNLDHAVLRPRLQVKNRLPGLRSWTVSRNSRFVAMEYGHRGLRLWDLHKGVLTGATNSHAAVELFHLSNRGNIYYTRQGIPGVSDPFGRDDTVARVAQAFDNIQHIASSANGLKLAIVHGRPVNITIIDLEQSVVTDALVSDKPIAQIVISNRSDLVFTTPNGELFFRELNGGLEQVRAINVGNDHRLFYGPEEEEVIAVTPDGVRTAWRPRASKSHKLPSEKLWDGLASRMQLLNDGRSGVVTIGSRATIFSPQNPAGSQNTSLSELEPQPPGALLVNNGEQILVANQQGDVRIYNASDHKKLAELYVTKTGWAIVDFEGRYDGSESALADVIWQAGDEEIPIEQFFDRYFEPGLLTHHLSGTSTLAAVPNLTIEGYKRPPSLEFEQFPDTAVAGSDYQFLVIAENQGGGIGDVRLYHNGKLLPRGALVQKTDHQGQYRFLAYRIKALPGTNTFRALAGNEAGIDGQGITRTFIAEGTGKAGTLHVVAVGINKYAVSELNLAYSVPDAVAIANYLADVKPADHANIEIHRLLDENASGQKLRQTLASLALSRAGDSVLFYLAGHGVANASDWFFLPQDAAGLSPSSSTGTSALSSTYLLDALVKIPAQRMMVMIDACFSGASVDAFYRFQNFQRKFSRKISRTAGVTILAATREDQKAAEMQNLGHGLFTFVVLQGLNGGADLSPRDGYVTAHELLAYSSQQIPNLARRFIGAAQQPTGFALGADFILRPGG